MPSTISTASSFLAYFDQQAALLGDALCSAIQRSDTIYALLAPDQQRSLARHLIVALREAAREGSAGPLLVVLDATSLESHLDDHGTPSQQYQHGHGGAAAPAGPQFLFALVREQAFDILKPWEQLNPGEGAEGMVAVADVLAQALVQCAERRVGEAQAQVIEQEQLYGLARDLSTVSHLDEVADVVAHYFEPLGAEVCTLYIYKDYERGVPLWSEAVASWQRGYEHPPQIGLRMYMPDFTFSQIVMSDQLIEVEDALRDERMCEKSYRIMEEMQLQALLSAPLMLRGHQLARIWVGWSAPRRFTAHELRLGQTVASLAPAIVERLQLQEEAQRRLEELAQLRDSLELQVAQRTAELHTFYTLAEHAPDAIAVAALDSSMVYANPAFRALLGYGDATIGMSFYDFAVSEERRLHEQVAAHVAQYGSWQGILTYRHRDGSAFKVQISTFVIRDDGGQPQAFAAIVRDVSIQQQLEQRLRTFYALAENAPDGIGVAALDGTMTYTNLAFQSMIGEQRPIIGMSMHELFAEPRERVEAITGHVLAHGSWVDMIRYRRHDGSTFPGQLSGFAIRDSEDRPLALVGICRDLTEQVRADEERNALQEQVIAAQQATLRELSTPIIPVADDLVVMPLVGSIDSGRAQQVIETLLEGVSSSRATTAILDITGVQVVDTQVANGLLRAAQAVKLLGAQVIITGIRPEVAQTLVGLGLDLSTIVTRATLQSGISFALGARPDDAVQGQANGYASKRKRW